VGGHSNKYPSCTKPRPLCAILKPQPYSQNVKRVNALSFHIIPSSESNDHQVRIFIDGEDWLRNDFLGVDPSSFFQQDSFLNGDLLVGRCTCGVEGCCDLIVNVHNDSEKVGWTNDDGLNLQFRKTEYLKIIEILKTDYSWEDINRRVERLISTLFIGTNITGGLTFDWASCRIEDKMICLSYSKKGLPEEFRQEIIKFGWDGISETDALTKADKFIYETKRITK